MLISFMMGLGMLLRPEHIAVFGGIITTVWTGYGMGKMDWNKPGA